MIWCRNASAANGLPYWATRFTYQIGQNSGSVVIRDRSLTNWSPPHYKLLSGAMLNTILAIQHKRFEYYTLWHSENTEWPTTEGGPLPDPIQYTLFPPMGTYATAKGKPAIAKYSSSMISFLGKRGRWCRGSRNVRWSSCQPRKDVVFH